MCGNDVNVDGIHTDKNNSIYKKGVIPSTFSISSTHERNLAVSATFRSFRF